MYHHPKLQASILGAVVLCEFLVMTYVVPIWTNTIVPLLPFGQAMSW